MRPVKALDWGMSGQELYMSDGGYRETRGESASRTISLYEWSGAAGLRLCQPLCEGWGHVYVSERGDVLFMTR